LGERQTQSQRLIKASHVAAIMTGFLDVILSVFGEEIYVACAFDLDGICRFAIDFCCTNKFRFRQKFRFDETTFNLMLSMSFCD
jgi:hypothetical protein